MFVLQDIVEQLTYDPDFSQAVSLADVRGAAAAAYSFLKVSGCTRGDHVPSGSMGPGPSCHGCHASVPSAATSTPHLPLAAAPPFHSNMWHTWSAGSGSARAACMLTHMGRPAQVGGAHQTWMGEDHAAPAT